MKIFLIYVIFAVFFVAVFGKPANKENKQGDDDKKQDKNAPKDEKKEDKKPSDEAKGKEVPKNVGSAVNENKEENGPVSLEEGKLTTKNESDDGSGSGDEPTTIKEIEEEEKAEENPDMFEGDIKIPSNEIETLKKGSFSRRDAVTSVARLWPNGRVPYVFDRKFDAKRKETFKKAVADFNKKTCIKLEPKSRNDKDYVRFIVDRGCYSTGIGKNPRGGEQKISIGEGCNWVGTIIHEIMHAIGFFHEQSRLDRDQFINIYWQNIKRGMESQFWNYAHGQADYLGEPYDFDSVMHYHRTAFSFNNENPTIVAKDKPWRQLGQRKSLSPVDASQVNKLYKCQIKKKNNQGKKNANGRAGAGRKGGRGPSDFVKILKFIK